MGRINCKMMQPACFVYVVAAVIILLLVQYLPPLDHDSDDSEDCLRRWGLFRSRRPCLRVGKSEWSARQTWKKTAVGEEATLVYVERTEVIYRKSAAIPPKKIKSAVRQKAEFRFANYFQDGMVLQRGKPGARVWGFGEANQEVHVTFQSSLLKTVIEADGTWLIQLPPSEAGGPYDIEATSVVDGDKEMVPLRAVLFGDVWLCSGQSNMEFQVQQMFNGTEELQYARTYKDSIRFLQILKSDAPNPLLEPDIYQAWAMPSSVSLAEFSAVCWAFGRRLQEKLDIPVGLIGSYYGGTPIRAWSPPEVGEQCPTTPLTDLEMPMYEPWLLKYPADPSVLWNAMIAPLTPLQIKGALWYQGEADAMGARPDDYLCLFPAMIASWRKAFRSARLPFGFVQIGDKNEEDTGTPVVRWHQTADVGFAPNKVLQNVFMAVAMDLPDPDSPYNSIHPRYKEEVAQRLTLGALNTVYGVKVPFQGPYPIALSQAGSQLTIHFDPAPIIVKNSSNHNFEVCCAGIPMSSWQDCHSWVPSSITSSTIKAITLDVTECQGKGVAFLRYAWKVTPCAYLRCDIYGTNTALPAPPFVIPVEGSKKLNSFRA
ncbi:hypothetical protein RvY_06791 [Ramazzottius varieornatus]|uniref:Sialate O-acetylesterase domain-containing protein n=1 Tax=Ramazzottius varieornatus TaxID=947166 RepID=A0A1D1UZU0_RAMVA|nr:hypothetical protein RvY_06791 [Ramazzottius varieornatus]